MPRKRKTGFDRYFDERMRDPDFAAEYRDARSAIDSTDALIRALESARAGEGASKADIARRMGTKPEAIRRLFTRAKANPTMNTVIRLAAALGYGLELVKRPATPARARQRRERGSRVDSRSLG